MKKLIFLFFIFYSTYAYSNNIVYLDVQFIIDNSELGKFYKNKINTFQEKNSLDFKSKEKEIEEKRIKINNQKNILSKDEIEKNVIELNNLIKKYQLSRNELNKKIIDRKKNYSSKILNILNPLLTSYVDKNNITLVIEKKNILVGVKSLDITKNILDILNDETKKKNLLNDKQ